ncbi:peptidase inhibitor family I36 protein [Fodinicola acaciae]|uniref:peptidase inhibitor family I36 protein n=1 Tax=Fodinicola acaciae TaxID=2681555 RepID=UPI0013D3890A|nr:peptidase inhibitor family I36 protein [Fodinicola acaciae]
MKRSLLVVAVVSAALLTIPQTAVARPAAAPCAAQTNCWWSLAGFTGQSATWQAPRPPGSCASAPNAVVRSYAFYGGQEGYFYRSNNCTGESRAVLANSESADLGFDAYSFKSACVSCKVNAGTLGGRQTTSHRP